MTRIQLITKINAPIHDVFDLSRNIDVHTKSAATSNEKAIAGVTSGLIGLNETVTWSGRHFGVTLKHQSRITMFQSPEFFVDEMETGHFKSFRHEHLFQAKNGITIMTDRLQYETPFGIFGRLFDQLLLKKHLTRFLLTRNKTLKELCENQQ